MIVLNSDPLVDGFRRQYTADGRRDSRESQSRGLISRHWPRLTQWMERLKMDGDWAWVDEKTLNQDLTKAAFALGAQK